MLFVKMKKDFPFKNEISAITKISVIKGYSLIMGAGKFGRKALNYFTKKNCGFCLIMDIDPVKLNDFNGIKPKSQNELMDILAEYASKVNFSNNHNLFEKSRCIIYNSGPELIPKIFTLGIPELIIPVVPIHLYAEITYYFLKYPLIYSNLYTTVEPERDDNRDQYTYTHSEDIYSKDLTERMDFIINNLPSDIIFGSDSRTGTILLSWASKGEKCPDNCPGPERYCPYHKKSKPFTITSAVRKLTEISGQPKGKELILFHVESNQIIPGLGGVYGIEFKENHIKLLKKIKNILNGIGGFRHERDLLILFFATTCNCHGIISPVILKFITD